MPKKKSKIWQEVEEAVASGKIPEVRISQAAKVVTPPREIGRPRVRPLGIKNAHYWPWKMKTLSGRAMRCRNPGCQRSISAREWSIVCDRPQCFTELLNYVRITLDVLEGRMHAEEYPPQYRAAHKQKQLARFAQINKKMNERKKAA